MVVGCLDFIPRLEEAAELLFGELVCTSCLLILWFLPLLLSEIVNTIYRRSTWLSLCPVEGQRDRKYFQKPITDGGMVEGRKTWQERKTEKENSELINKDKSEKQYGNN